MSTEPDRHRPQEPSVDDITGLREQVAEVKRDYAILCRALETEREKRRVVEEQIRATREGVEQLTDKWSDCMTKVSDTLGLMARCITPRAVAGSESRVRD